MLAKLLYNASNETPFFMANSKYSFLQTLMANMLKISSKAINLLCDKQFDSTQK